MPFTVRALVFIAWAGAERFYPGRTSCHPLLHCTGLEPRRLSDLGRTVSLRLVTSQPMLLNTHTIEGLTLPAGFLVAETGRAAAGRMSTCAGAMGYHLSHRVCIELSRSGSRTRSIWAGEDVCSGFCPERVSVIARCITLVKLCDRTDLLGCLL